jgi:hypothetical protein
MDEADADRRAEMPEDSRKVAGGTSENKRRERQASTAVKEKIQPGVEMLLEEVLRRENMLRALQTVCLLQVKATTERNEANTSLAKALFLP